VGPGILGSYGKHANGLCHTHNVHGQFSWQLAYTRSISKFRYICKHFSCLSSREYVRIYPDSGCCSVSVKTIICSDEFMGTLIFGPHALHFLGIGYIRPYSGRHSSNICFPFSIILLCLRCIKCMRNREVSRLRQFLLFLTQADLFRLRVIMGIQAQK